ncbi:hypothetical protein [Wolbachia endosymbiont of Pentidionis agamae]|uniref:hypothetical protein n=1 Tax=Wolbachia endosymbiont of Pentidionis agamae TaxID=3110435 RepID=UPI002FD42B40
MIGSSLKERFIKSKKKNWSFGFAGKSVEAYKDISSDTYLIVTKGWFGIYGVYQFNSNNKTSEKKANSIGKPKFDKNKNSLTLKRLFAKKIRVLCINDFQDIKTADINGKFASEQAIKVNKEIVSNDKENILICAEEYFDALEELECQQSSNFKVGEENEEYFDALLPEELKNQQSSDHEERKENKECFKYKNNQYYKGNEEVKNSDIFKSNNMIALALYNQPDRDEIKIEAQPQSELKNSTKFKLTKFELGENGYTAKLENCEKIMTITGKCAYIVIPDFMDLNIKRENDKRINIGSGIPGYYDDNPVVNAKVNFNAMIMLNTGVDVNNLFKLHKLLSLAKGRGAYGGYRISHEQEGYTKFNIDSDNITIEVDKSKAVDFYHQKKYHPAWISSIVKLMPFLKNVIGKVYDSVVNALKEKISDSCEVDEKTGNLNLKLTQEDVLINGEILNRQVSVSSAVNTDVNTELEHVSLSCYNSTSIAISRI